MVDFLFVFDMSNSENAESRGGGLDYNPNVLCKTRFIINKFALGTIF